MVCDSNTRCKQSCISNNPASVSAVTASHIGSTMLYKQRYVQSCSTSTCGRSLSVARRSFHAITSAAMTARKAAVTVVTCKASKSRPGVKQSPARSCGFGAHILSSRVSRRQGYSCSSSNMRMSDPASKPNILPTEGNMLLHCNPTLGVTVLHGWIDRNPLPARQQKSATASDA